MGIDLLREGLDTPDADEAFKLFDELEERMNAAAENLEFELAADIRDRSIDLRQEFDLGGGEVDEGVPAPEPDLDF